MRHAQCKHAIVQRCNVKLPGVATMQQRLRQVQVAATAPQDLRGELRARFPGRVEGAYRLLSSVVSRPLRSRRQVTSCAPHGAHGATWCMLYVARRMRPAVCPGAARAVRELLCNDTRALGGGPAAQ